jgi:diguanylate cyclase (GGDEF)-like protein
VDLVSLPTGLILAAVACGVLGGTGVAVLLVAARRSVLGARGRLGWPALRDPAGGGWAPGLVALAGVVAIAGAVAVAASSAGVAAGDRTGRLWLVAEFDVAFVGWAGLFLAGLLFLPGISGGARTRLRHVVDGVLLAAGGFFAAWTLLVQPMHEARLGGPVPVKLVAGCLAVSVPALVAGVTLGVVTVVGARARRPAGLVAACAGAGLVAVCGLGLVLALRYGGGGAVLGTATGQAIGQLTLALAVRSVVREPPVATDRTGDRPAISLIAAAMALLAGLIRVSTGHVLDSVGVSAVAVICAALAAQQALARLDIRRYAAEKARSEERYRVMAHTDALTGLANRRQLLHTLHDEAVGGPPCVLLAIDLDGFKNINDTRGHDAGDAVLVEVAERLRTNLRPGDLAARLGGDEFAVLMWARPAEALVVAERLLRVLGAPYDLLTGTVFATASIGLAGCATADDVPSLLRNADLALRFAKQRGKHRVERYDRTYDAQVRRRTGLEHELRGAAGRGELMVVYQPIVQLPDGAGSPGGRAGNSGAGNGGAGNGGAARVVGVEALLHWQHPAFGTVPPEEFVPLAEESGLIAGLGSYVRHEACHQLSRWRGDGHDGWLAVNVSVRELHHPDFLAELSDLLRQHRLPADQLVVEVTEHAVAVDLAAVVERLTALRATGVRVALDEFGSRYSSLSQLRTLPVDILKIDRSFLAMPDRPGVRFAAPLVDVVARLGNRLGLDVVAEGITEASQCRMVRDAGCRYAQGSLLGRPMPAERVEAVLGAHLPFPGDVYGDVQKVGPVDSAHEMRQS